MAKTYNVRSSIVHRFNADMPVVVETVIPAIAGFPGMSDEIRLARGECLRIVEPGSPTSWAKAVIVPASR